MEWKQLSQKIDNEIIVGTEVPKTRKGTITVTKKMGNRIYMRTGVKTKAEKYITKEMVEFAYNKINFGEKLTMHNLSECFPEECSQGGCILSMTCGILVKFGIARYEYKGYVLK